VLLAAGVLLMVPIVPRADTSYTLAPISEERVGEAAGVISAISSFGLSVGLAFTGAILLAAMAILFSAKSDASTVLAPAEKDQVAEVLEHDTQVMSDAETRDEILRVNADARAQALQIALLVPLLVPLLGLALSFRMMRLPDPAPSQAAELAALG
jgi:hypothetical protein